VYKNLDKDNNESSNSDSMRYCNNNEETDQEAEINTLYISQNDEKFNEQINSIDDREEINRDEKNDEDDDEEEENDKFQTRNYGKDKCTNKKGNAARGGFKTQNNDENHSLKSNKRRKPHNPQKLSTQADLASRGKTTSSSKCEKVSENQINNQMDKE
jgi:hypothetical protein